MYHRCDECGKLFNGNTEKGYIMSDEMDTFCDEECCTSFHGRPYSEMYNHDDEDNTPVFWTRDEEDDIESLYELATDGEMLKILGGKA
jgi:hypothetical protein